jgi:hypothetical protein
MTSGGFIDPRGRPVPGQPRTGARTTSDPEELAELHALCRHGRLYDVEEWVRHGRPLRLDPETPRPRRWMSALELGIESGSHGLVLLLLCNGYDPDLEPDSPLDLALASRRWDLLDLLLDWGADPSRVDLRTLFETYQSDLFRRFRELGVDLTKGHALAEALAEHSSHKPLFGFAKRLRPQDPRIQRELDMALLHHAGRGNAKGVQLCLWAGADPHARTPDLRDVDDDEDADDCFGVTPIWMACLHGDPDIVRRLGPDPETDDFDALYQVTDSAAVLEILAESALPRDVGSVIASHLSAFDFRTNSWRSTHILRKLFEIGIRWEDATKDGVARVRSDLLQLPEESFVEIVKLLAERDHCAPALLKELGRTPAMRKKMKKVGFYPPSEEDQRRREQIRPTRGREVLKKFGIEIPKPPKPKRRRPQAIEIAPERRGRREIRLSREELYERVWTEPVAAVAERWGISGPGLAKACRRAEIPVPPRGYWAKVHAEKKPRRTPLPKLKEGEVERVMIWVRGEVGAQGEAERKGHRP